MFVRVLLLLGLALVTTQADVTVPTAQLFRNTLRKWGIDAQGNDRSERYARLLQFQASVEKTTTNTKLEFLNRFSVMNDEEFEVIKKGQDRMNTSFVVNEEDSAPRRSKRSSSLPATYDYWENTVGFVAVKDQLSCGSCWSFPTTGSVEALYKEMTGETVDFSEQYFVDCTFDYDGCGGGVTNDGFKVIKSRQYMKSTEDFPYSAYYQACPFDDDYATRTGNAFTKLWFQNFNKLANDETSFLEGLTSTSPVAYLQYISNDFLSYSGGDYTDVNCASIANTHVMLLVGYTETTFRIRASYGADWGDAGYVNYNRDDNAVTCNMFKNAYVIRVTYAREFEYSYCSDGAKSLYEDCKASCEADGLTLAVIPSEYHNDMIVAMIQSDYGSTEASDDTFNLFWMGLVDLEKTGDSSWIDDFTPVGYNNRESYTTNRKWGLIHKISGQWYTKNSDTYQARGLCSKPTTCWDLSSYVSGATVTYSDDARTDGTTASFVCDDGALSGVSLLTCNSGLWSDDIPTCSGESVSCTYNDEAGSGSTINPSKTSFNNGEQVTVKCADDSTTYHECQGGSFSPTITACESQVTTCYAPDEDLATVVPVKSTFEEGELVTATCITVNATDNFVCEEGRFMNDDDKTIDAVCGCLSVAINVVLLLSVTFLQLLTRQ